MYLPQFHRTEENDKWWGEGFTEWTAVKAAVPLYSGHKQPKVPLNNNYYNLLEKETMSHQAELMKKYGIDGQCFYHYYFKDGKKVLEKPAENLLKWKEINMPFCFCWANSSWVRTWSNISNGNVWSDKFEKIEKDSYGRGILLEQKYGREQEWKKHFEYLLPFFNDERYIKIDNKPIFLFFATNQLFVLHQMIDYWRELALKAGLQGLYFIGMNTANVKNGLDAVLLNAPNMYLNFDKVERIGGICRPNYKEIWEKILSASINETGDTYFGAVINYDDTPRRGKNGCSFKNFSLETFADGMQKLYQKCASLNHEFVFINAWNEWGEGMHLEPDEENGYAYLEAVLNAKTMPITNTEIQEYKKEMNQVSQNGNDWKDKWEKSYKMMSCLDKWLLLKEEGKQLSEYLEKYDVKTVAVYGMGVLGRHLISELSNSNIEIKYIIDRRSELHHTKYDVKSVEDELPCVDAVIITPIADFDSIYKILKEKMQCRFFSIEELIGEM